MSRNWKGELTEYSGVRFLGTDCDRDRFIEDMRREAEGLWRCGGDDDEEAWSRLSEVDAIDFETRNTNKSRGYASDSVEDSEGVLKEGRIDSGMDLDKEPTCGCADIKIVFPRNNKTCKDIYIFTAIS